MPGLRRSARPGAAGRSSPALDPSECARVRIRRAHGAVARKRDRWFHRQRTGRGAMDRDIEGQHRTARGAAGDRELLALVAAGDGPAGQELVARYERLVGAAARRVLFAGPDVDDVVQETFLALLLH